MKARYRNFATTEEEREKAQFEIDYLLHYLLDGRFFPLVHGKTGKAEKTCTYPDLSEGGKKEYDHLLYRANSSKNPLLKAKFYHILWQCPSGLKNRQYAESAASNYVESIDLLINQLSIKTSGDLLSIMQQDFENLTALCKELKLTEIDLNGILKRLMAENFPFYVKEHLASLVLKYPTLFSKESLTLCYSVHEDHFWKDENRNDPFLIIHNYAPNAIKFAQKLKSDQKRWYELIGELHLADVKKETDKNRDWLSLNKLLDAQNNLKKSGNQALLKEAEELYEKIRPTVKIGSKSIKITRNSHQELFDYRDSRVDLAKKLIKETNSDLIYSRLISGVDFPKAVAFKNRANDIVPDFFRGVQTIFFDINGNTTKGSDDLDDKVMLMDSYQMELDFQTIPFFCMSFSLRELSLEN